MKRLLRYLNILVTIRILLAKSGPDLPLCPMNIQYFPQNLPMHCRMPQDSDSNTDSHKLRESGSGPTFTPPPFQYQSPPLSKTPSPINFPVSPGFPAPIYPPPAIGGPVPIMPAAPHKLPVIVMPFYAPDRSYDKTTPPPDEKKRRKKNRRTDTEYSDDYDYDSSDRDSDSSGYWKPRHKAKRSGRRSGGFSSRSRRHYRRHGKHGKKKDFLTPIIQYVTNDGYVIFEKEISKNEAKDWLNPSKKINVNEEKVEEVIALDSGDNKVGNGNNGNKNVQDAEEKPFIDLEDEEPTTEGQQQVEDILSRKNKKSRKKRQKQDADNDGGVQIQTIKL